MRVFEGSTRMAFLGYFLSHVFFTIFFDSQGVFGPYFPKVLTDVVAWYCSITGDFLMRDTPSIDYAWFSSLLCCEILFQFPFFFVAIKCILAEGKDNSSSESRRLQHYPEWFRMACIIYGTHVCTTLVPITAAFATNREMTIQQKCGTIASKYTKRGEPTMARTSPIFRSWLSLFASNHFFFSCLILH